MIWRWLPVLAILCLPFTAKANSDCGEMTNYHGPDAGNFIMTLGAVPKLPYDSYWLYFRSADHCRTGTIALLPDNIFAPKPDIDNESEQAEVSVWALPPGNYEFYNFEVRSNSAFSGGRFGPKEDFSIPFTIVPGHTVYLGDFRAHGMTGRNIFGIPVKGGVSFVVSDQSKRDIPIARTRPVSIQSIDIKLPAIRAMNNPLFQAGP